MEPKGFWKRPEGKSGLVVTLAAIAAAVYGFSLILPWLKAFLFDAAGAALNLLHLGMVVGAGAVILMIVADKDFRMNVGYGFKMLMRKMTGVLIAIDPIEIMKIARDKLSTRLKEMDEAISSLGGQIFKLREDITVGDKQREHSLAIAGEAKRAGKTAIAVLQARQAGRLRESNLSLKDLLKRMTSLHSNLRKARGAADFLIQDMNGEIADQERKRKAMKAAYKAMIAGRSVLQGGADRSMYDEAMEASANDYAMKAGEIEQFMDVSQTFIDGVDLENRAYGVEALAELEKWDERIDKIVEPGSKPLSRLPAEDADPRLRVVGGHEDPEETEADEGRSSFANLFDDDSTSRKG